MASTDEGRWLEGIQHPEQHDPLCPESWQPGYYLCICDRLRACEQRVTERHNAEHEDDRLAAFQNGYDAATVKERQRSVLLIADAYGKGLSAARDAVEAENKNPISRVTTDYDIGYRDGTNDTVRLHLRAIDALTTSGKEGR